MDGWGIEGLYAQADALMNRIPFAEPIQSFTFHGLWLCAGRLAECGGGFACGKKLKNNAVRIV
ncbi:hypothetical protein AA3271_2287 [Gluconobacter japonicus NBRC 3271]|nr:hypothetical protein AA3271_2287 [Gluconobacter japonicus NBRC 3271]